GVGRRAAVVLVGGAGGRAEDEGQDEGQGQPGGRTGSGDVHGNQRMKEDWAGGDPRASEKFTPPAGRGPGRNPAAAAGRLAPDLSFVVARGMPPARRKKEKRRRA